MDEQEEKTFKFLKDIYNLNFKSCTLENCDIKNIVNIIEKQQKEIEDLRNPTICGRTIEEIMNILNGLDFEKETELNVTMENLKYFMAIYQDEIENSLRNVTTNFIKDISGTGAKIEFQIPHYDFLKKGE